MSSFSSATARVIAPYMVAVALLGGCSREDIELAPGAVAPPPAGDCSAEVPEGLLAARPPMGWNGFNAFSCAPELNEAKLLAIADALVATGMQSAGYQYLNLDACWQLARAEDGTRVFDPVRLPGGIRMLADEVHSRGLSLGVFARVRDCLGEPGSLGWETSDAASYAEWGTDYLKYVDCAADQSSEAVVSTMADALRQTGRPIVLSFVAPPFSEWMRDHANLWRTGSPAQPTFASIVASIDTTVPLAAYARPGAFNDPDMLEIGNGELTAGEKRVQFSVWSILSAPLLAGNDLTQMDEETAGILTNQRVIALNQDPLGLQAPLIRREGQVDVLAKPLSECGARGVVLWNRGEMSADVSIGWEELWLEPEAATVHDLWLDTALEAGPEGFTVTIPGHDARALRVSGSEPPLPHGRRHLSDLRVTYATNGWGPVELDSTNGEDAALDGQPIRLRGAAYEKGLGVHAPSLLRYRLDRACSRFVADVGIDDDQMGAGSVEFEVWADGERLFRSGVLTGTSPSRAVNLDVSGRRELRLFVSTGGDSATLDHGVWAGARLDCGPAGAASQ